jgi:DNA transposition AAA+ family ATPase
MARKNENPVKANATFTLGANQVRPALAQMEAEGKCTADQRELMWWYFCWCKEQDYSLTKSGDEIGVSSTTVYRILTNTYAAAVDNFADKIASYRRIVEGRAQIKSAGFMQTSLTTRIFNACSAALISQTIVLLYGDSQIGKTRALEEYARENNHGQTIYVRLPASSGVQLVAKEIAKACYVSPNSCFEKLRERILKSIGENNLVIIDELHQVFMSYHKHSQIKVLEFIREIYDRTNCGMVLCGTHVLRTEIETGKLALMLEQLRRRCTHTIQLPSKTSRADLVKIADRFGLPEPGGDEQEIIKDMIHKSGLGMYIKFLQASSRLASRRGEDLEWSHFGHAYNIIRKLGGQ